MERALDHLVTTLGHARGNHRLFGIINQGFRARAQDNHRNADLCDRLILGQPITGLKGKFQPTPGR